MGITRALEQDAGEGARCQYRVVGQFGRSWLGMRWYRRAWCWFPGRVP